MVAKPLCPLYKNIIKPLDRARYPELRYVDSLFQLYAYTSYRGKCKLFTQTVGNQNEMYSAELGLFDDGMIGEEGRISVKRGRDNLQKDFTPFFKENEIVRVKFSSLGEEGYAFWRSFEDMAALSRIESVN